MIGMVMYNGGIGHAGAKRSGNAGPTVEYLTTCQLSAFKGAVKWDELTVTNG